MEKNFVKLVERDSASELQAYFENMPEGKPLDIHEEKLLLEYFSPLAVKSYINRFRFSEKAEKIFIEKASSELRRTYIHYYGLQKSTERFLVDKNLTAAAIDYTDTRGFDDVNYLLKYGSAALIRDHLRENKLETDQQVLMLLHHENKGLFPMYLRKGRFISEAVQTVLVEERCHDAFKALTSYYYSQYSKKCHGTHMTYDEMVKKGLTGLFLSESIQLKVIDSEDKRLIEQMILTTPLCLAVQKLMFERNYGPGWFKNHVEHLYGVGGYRFEPELEKRLFKLLASKDLDDCLTKFRLRDDMSFVQNASPAAIAKYIKDYWLSDEAQVALVARGNIELIEKFISRFTPEHGMCWQAEVKLVEICSPKTIMLYTAFHSMCGDALALLGKKSQEALADYYTKHAY